MTITSTDFRSNFPEFTSTTSYPDSQIDFWLGLAAQLMDATRWGDLYDYGIQLIAAHNLTLARKNALAAVASVPGAITGVMSSKSVDKVSMSYDTTTATIIGAGAWNLSSYGIQWYGLSQLVGAGGAQL